MLNRPNFVRNQNSERSSDSQKSHSRLKPICEFVFPNSVADEDEPKILYASSRTEYHVHSSRSRLTSASGSDAPIYLYSSSFTDRDSPFDTTNKNSKLRHEMEGIESERTKILRQKKRKQENAAIIIQKYVRRWLIYLRYDKSEKLRQCYREDTIRDAENQAIIACKDKLTDTKKKGTIDDMKQKLREEAEPLLTRKFSADEEGDKLEILFKKCDISNKGYLTFNEVQYLVYDIFQLVPLKDHLQRYCDPKNTNQITFKSFFRWFKYYRGKWTRSSSIHKIIARSRGAFSGVKNTNEMDSISVTCMQKKYINIYRNNVLKHFDQVNPPDFQCPRCKLVSTRPFKLAQHIVFCKKRK